MIMKKVRPLSPHLAVYKPQLTSVLSIFHRITGSLLGFSIVLMFLLFYSNLFFVGSSVQYCVLFDLFSLLSTLILAICYFVLFAISFHMINGIRHLSWDLAFGLEIKNLYTTGMIVVGLVSAIMVITIIV
jgi:succinate dehydrogenase / fumarate reductase cytochrome b subunit